MSTSGGDNEQYLYVVLSPTDIEKFLKEAPDSQYVAIKVVILAVALTAAFAQQGQEYGHGHGYEHGHATSSQSIVLHQIKHEPQHHEYHVQPISYHHAAPEVHYTAPVVHHVAPVVQHYAPVVHQAIPVVHHSAPVVHAAPVHHTEEHHDYHSHPKYEFAYDVQDKHTGDFKSQHESRDGDVVKGYYSLHEADGTTRIVHYTADKHNGFNAQVERKGHAKHIEPVHHHHY